MELLFEGRLLKGLPGTQVCGSVGAQKVMSEPAPRDPSIKQELSPWVTPLFSDSHLLKSGLSNCWTIHCDIILKGL